MKITVFNGLSSTYNRRQIVETLYSNRVTSENKRIHTPPLSPPFKVGRFVISKGSSNSGTTLHGGDGGGGGSYNYFPLQGQKKCQKAPLGQSVSTHFVGDCNLIQNFLFIPSPINIKLIRELKALTKELE